MVVLSELESVWARRFFAPQRAAGGGFCIFAAALSTALSDNETAIIAALAAAGKAAQYAQLAVTLYGVPYLRGCFQLGHILA